jgi:hypothetical protein
MRETSSLPTAIYVSLMEGFLREQDTLARIEEMIPVYNE